MLRRSSKVSAFLPLDAAFAFGIVLLNIAPNPWLASLKDLGSVRVGFVDSLFAIIFLFAWTAAFAYYDLYNKLSTVQSRFLNILKGVVLLSVLTVVYLRLFHHRWLGLRSTFFMLVFLVLYELNRVAIRFYLLDRLAARTPRRALIIGSGRRASKAWRELRVRYHLSIRLMGFIDDRSPDKMPPDVAQRYRGNLSQLAELMRTEVIDLFLIAMPAQSCYAQMQEAIRIGEEAGVEVVYLSDLYVSRVAAGSYAQTIFQELQPKHDKFLLHTALKRLLDVCVALTSLILLSPIFAAIALAVRLSSPGPVIFRQKRMGLYRRQFTIYKFRSMVVDAEAMMHSLQHANEMPGPAFKMKNDPRVTRLGRLLRATSLDELPQLWNILRGDMSLVGPRPMSVRDVELFSSSALMRRFSVKPGLTGLWQVTGRSRTTFDKWMELDSRYIDEWSLLLDLKILCRTVVIVLSRSGAM